MNVLALETGSEWCDVAVGDGTHWAVRSHHAGQAHSERIMSMVDAALAEAGVALRDLDGIAFGAGPGAFTGVRIACGIAQGLSLGTGVPGRARVDAQGARRSRAALPWLDAGPCGAGRAHGRGLRRRASL